MAGQDVMVVIGTRPEAIKMVPVIKALQARKSGRTILCVTAQHRELLDQVLAVFALKPDIDMNLMTPGQDLATLTARTLTGVRDAIRSEKPHAVLVHGDTLTAMAAGLAAFYEKIPVGHVEAGLRTHNLQAPFPEELNRRIVDTLSHWYFAPTQAASDNLKAERVATDRIFVTGNTAVDALNMAVAMVRQSPPQLDGIDRESLTGKRIVLVTGHRRENMGVAFENVCMALRDISELASDVAVVYPLHLNPGVQEPARRLLAGHPRIHLLPPQAYLPFVWLMQQSTLILTDSGGIQEEAPSLGKPVLVMRESTERPEAIRAGVARLVGTNRSRILQESARLLTDPAAYNAMARVRNPYGDGQAAPRIVAALEN